MKKLSHFARVALSFRAPYIQPTHRCRLGQKIRTDTNTQIELWYHRRALSLKFVRELRSSQRRCNEAEKELYRDNQKEKRPKLYAKSSRLVGGFGNEHAAERISAYLSIHI